MKNCILVGKGRFYFLLRSNSDYRCVSERSTEANAVTAKPGAETNNAHAHLMMTYFLKIQLEF